MLQKLKDFPVPSLEFIDLARQQSTIRPALDLALKRVLDHGQYIMGPEVQQLEEDLSKFCGARHVITCANGTDSMGMILMARQIGKGDAVFVPSFTYAATAEVVAWVGATPVFIDIHEDTFNMDPASLQAGIQWAKSQGLKPAAVIPVDLFGQPADYPAIEAVAQENNLWILCDAAQSFGATTDGRFVGSIGLATSTSFFPAKPLGCYGDGGAVFTQDDELAEILRSLRVHGKGQDKYDNVRIGLNARLDTIQAAVLIEKLKIFPQEIKNRQNAAAYYNAALKDAVKIPVLPKGLTSTWAQYTVCLPPEKCRKKVMQALHAGGIPSVIYYVKPLHLQTAYAPYHALRGVELPVCERVCQRVLSLPMHGYLTQADQDMIIEAMHAALKA